MRKMTCQVCGRMIAVSKKGRIHLHACPGSRCEPYEVSCAEVISLARDFCQRRDLIIANIRHVERGPNSVQFTLPGTGKVFRVSKPPEWTLKSYSKDPRSYAGIVREKLRVLHRNLAIVTDWVDRMEKRVSQWRPETGSPRSFVIAEQHDS